MDQSKRIELNKRQREFVKYVIDSYRQKKSEIVVVNSPGGTGKTTCIKHLLDKLPSLSNIFDFKVEINVLAPTHKAASLFKRANISALTIHRFFGVKPYYDEHGNQIYDFSNIDVQHKFKEESFKILFVDECSMIDSKMIVGFNEYKNKYKALIVFLGDEKQLPPVEKNITLANVTIDTSTNIVGNSSAKDEVENISPVFSKHLVATKFFFTENVRAKNQRIGKIVDFFRDNISKLDVIHMVEPCQSLFLTIEDAIDIYNQDMFSKTKNDWVYLTYTNKKKDEVNSRIRNRIYGQDSYEYMEGEKVIFSGYKDHLVESLFFESFFSNEKLTQDKEDKIGFPLNNISEYVLTILADNQLINNKNYSFYSSDEIKIDKVETVELTLDFIQNGKPLSFLVLFFYIKIKIDACENTKKRTLDGEFISSSPSHELIKFKWLTPTGETIQIMKDWFKHMRDTTRKTYCEKINDINKKINKCTKEIDDLKKDGYHTEHPTIVDYENEIKTKKKERLEIYNSMQNDWKNYMFLKNLLFPKLDYCYAMTVHKSQGSQWNNVFVDIPSMFKSDNDTWLKLIYTAVSRAENAVIFTK